MLRFLTGLAHALKRAHRARNLRVRTLRLNSKVQPFSLKATYTPVSKRPCSRSAKLSVSFLCLSGITEVVRVIPSNSHQKEARSHGIIEQRTKESFDR